MWWGGWLSRAISRKHHIGHSHIELGIMIQSMIRGGNFAWFLDNFAIDNNLGVDHDEVVDIGRLHETYNELSLRK